MKIPISYGGFLFCTKIKNRLDRTLNDFFIIIFLLLKIKQLYHLRYTS